MSYQQQQQQLHDSPQSAHCRHDIQVAGHQCLRLSASGDTYAKPVSRDAVIFQHLVHCGVGGPATHDDNGGEVAGGNAELDGAEDNHTLPSLGFLAPFVPMCTGAAFARPLPPPPSLPVRNADEEEEEVSGAASFSSSAEERDPMALLSTLRQGLLRQEEQQQKLTGITFLEYFNECRRILEAAEVRLGAEADAYHQQQANLQTNNSAAIDVDAPAFAAAADSPIPPLLPSPSVQQPPTSPTLSHSPSSPPPQEEATKKQKKTKSSKSSVSKPWEVSMRNACHGMACPCVLDVKVGRVRTAPNAKGAAEKEAKDDGTTARIHGARLTGMHYGAFLCSSPLLTADGSAGCCGSSSAPPPPPQWAVLSDKLPKGWERDTIPSAERLGDVLNAFTCRTEMRRRPTTEGAGEGAVTATSPNAVADDDDGAIAAIANSVFIEGRKGIERAIDGAHGDDRHHQPAIVSFATATPLPSLRADVYRQLRALVDTLRQPACGKIICEDYAFLSTSILIVYDAAAYSNAHRQGAGLVSPQSSLSSPSPSSSPSCKVLLIDFDRCGPRSEHYGEGRIQFVEAIEALAAYFKA